jgi:hypothetical protein
MRRSAPKGMTMRFHDTNRGQLAGSEEGLTMWALAEEKDR